MAVLRRRGFVALEKWNNDVREKQKTGDTVKANLKLLHRNNILMEKMVSITAELQTIILEPADY